MLNKQDRSLTLNLGGAVRKFRLDLNAIIRFRNATGIDLMSPDPERPIFAPGNVDPDLLRTLLWAGFVRESETRNGAGVTDELSVEEVGGWLDVGNLMALVPQLETYLQFVVPESVRVQGGKVGKDRVPGAG